MHTVSITDGAAAAATVQSGGVTVADVLATQGIALAPNDPVDPAAGTPVTDGTAIAITRVAVTTSTDTVDVAPVPTSPSTIRTSTRAPPTSPSPAPRASSRSSPR